jgi:hypothetical protein
MNVQSPLFYVLNFLAFKSVVLLYQNESVHLLISSLIKYLCRKIMIFIVVLH